MPQNDAFLNTVRSVLEAYAPEDKKAVSTLNRVLELWPDLVLEVDQSAPITLPVCRHLSRVLDLGEAGPVAAVAIAIRQIEGNLVWAQSGRHTLEARGAEFMENYAYSSLGVSGSKILDVGVLLLGPSVTYPVTSYPSEGVFLVIGGSPEWKSGGDPWRRVSAGDIIHRPYNGAEGKRPGSEPMLAFYAWLCD